LNDKELLELAAKAAGIEIEWYAPNVEVWDFAQVPNWNPLTDDGDALRLAVKLCLLNNHEIAIAPVNVWHGDDPYAATRRAIVRAAAEIGKNK
jgi:hypothetical protein